jgi:sugar phosphate isomerase/epimerase
MDRRDFLKKSALTIAGALVGGSVFSELSASSALAAKQKTKRIGLQLYSLREMMGKDPEATLKLIASMGYKDLETASYDGNKIYGYTPKDFRALIESLGMKVESCHIGQSWDPAREAELMAWWEKAFDDHKALGCKYVIVPSANYGKTLESLKATCDYWSKLGAMAKKKGLKFGYHNHSHEFNLMEGEIPYDFMLQNTTKNVVFEMDVYWVTRGGHNPVDYLKKYAGRFPLLHIKDDSIIGNSGKMNFEAIFEAAYAQGMKDYFVEVEQYELSPELSVSKSFDYLNAAPFVK